MFNSELGGRFRSAAFYTMAISTISWVWRQFLMTKPFLTPIESDNFGNAITSHLAKTTGYTPAQEGETGGPDEVIIVSEPWFSSDDFSLPKQGLVQLLGCWPSPSFVARMIESGTKVAGISPVIAPRVANRVVGFGGPLRVKPDARWGVVGLGVVGTEVARKLTASGSPVEIADIRTPRSGILSELNIRRQSIDLLVTGSDVVTLHVPAGPTASPLISERELNLMKPGAVMINTSHSSVVDEQAVVDALSDGSLGGYATDCPGQVILEASLDEESSLNSSGNLFITQNPLINQVGAAQQIAKYVVANFEAFSNGGDIQGIIEPVDFPTIGDPSFWSSKMSPRQD